MANNADRGERAQVECIECDTWVVLMPGGDKAIQGAYVGADAVSPGVTERFRSVRAFVGRCSGCGAFMTLASVVLEDGRPKAEA